MNEERDKKPTLWWVFLYRSDGGNKIVWLLYLIVLLSGCSSRLSNESRLHTATQLALEGSFVEDKIQTGSFLLTTYQRVGASKNPLVVYIEGDGFAWITRHHISSDPTPINPVALRLAAVDPAENLLYIARPCQYVWPGQDQLCRKEYWSSKRSSEEVVLAIDNVISLIKQRTGVDSIRLVGYSGGAAIAVLVAARREDIKQIITVAGNLNYQLFTSTHNLTPITESLDPIHVSKKISQIPQMHFVGENDGVIPEQIARSFSNMVKVVSGISHSEGWVTQWRELLEKYVVESDY